MKSKPKFRERMIRKVATENGIEITSVKWEPIGIALEMCGPSGGWYVETENHGPFCAYHYMQILKDMREIGTRKEKRNAKPRNA